MLENLLLLRLWAAPDAAQGEVRSRVAADLRPLAGEPAQDGKGWQTAFAGAVERLAREGCLTVGGRAGARLMLSDAGRARVRSVFQISDEGGPGRGGRKRTAGWAWWRDHHALPLALGGELPGTTDALRSALLRRLYLPDWPQGRRPASLATMVDLMLAKRLKASQANPAAFRQALLREWARGGAAPENAAPPDEAPPKREAAPARRLPEDLGLFAERTLLAARRSLTGRFGEAKVFISHVWRGLLDAGEAAPDERDAFKERLVRANTAGRLRLSRADLAGAHASQDVRESEVPYLGETFHFVRLD